MIRRSKSARRPSLRPTDYPAQLLGRNFLCSGYIWNPVEARLSDDKGARVLVVDRLVLFHLPSRSAGTLLSHLYVRQCLTRRAMSENRYLVSKGEIPLLELLVALYLSIDRSSAPVFVMG